MTDQYLYISPSKSDVFPCNFRELKKTLKSHETILEKWPGHGQGKEFRDTDKGAIVLDLLNPDPENPGKPMTVEKLKEIGAL